MQHELMCLLYVSVLGIIIKETPYRVPLELTSGSLKWEISSEGLNPQGSPESKCPIPQVPRHSNFNNKNKTLKQKGCRISKSKNREARNT